MLKTKGIFMLVIVVLCVGCQSGVKNEKEVYVLAAASLTESMEEIIELYNEENKQVKIVLNLASSGSLQRQIEQGAPADVFISASLGKMKTLEEEGLIHGEHINLLKNEIVLAVPKGSTVIKGFDSLKEDEDFIVAMGEPQSVPAGKYAYEVLTYLNIYDLLKNKMVMAKDVKEVLTWIEAGEVDAGLVYATDGLVSDKVSVVDQAPEGSHNPIIYPCSVVEHSQYKDESKAFMEFLKTKEVKTIFEKYGFACYE